MANGMFDLTGWRIMTPEEIAADAEEMRLRTEEFDRRWPPSQRRPRCSNCGAFMRKGHDWYSKCKCCGESWASLQ